MEIIYKNEANAGDWVKVEMESYPNIVGMANCISESIFDRKAPLIFQSLILAIIIDSYSSSPTLCEF